MRLPISLITLTLAAILAGAATVATASTTASSGGERFTVSGATIRGVDRPLRVTALGPIAGSGAVQDNGPARHDTLVFHFAKGTVALTADEKSIAARPDFHTCTARIVARGSFRITGGTGAFRAAAGNGTFTRDTRIIGGRTSSGTCLPKSAPPKAIYNTVTMTGKATVTSV